MTHVIVRIQKNKQTQSDGRMVTMSFGDTSNPELKLASLVKFSAAWYSPQKKTYSDILEVGLFQGLRSFFEVNHLLVTHKTFFDDVTST